MYLAGKPYDERGTNKTIRSGRCAVFRKGINCCGGPLWVCTCDKAVDAEYAPTALFASAYAALNGLSERSRSADRSGADSAAWRVLAIHWLVQPGLGELR